MLSVPSQELLEDVPEESDTRTDLQDVVARSYLDPTFTSKWCPVLTQRITNKALQDQFEERKVELTAKAKKGDDVEEKYGFVVETTATGVDILASLGLQARDSDYNSLGYNRLGVYLCKHADVCLQHASVKHSASKVLRLIIVKYILGRYTAAVPRVASATEFIEPTMGFDSHISVMSTSLTDSLQDQYDRSQVYLYEANRMQQFVSRPRHVLPYAVITYTVDGCPIPPPEPLTEVSDPLESNARLQAIVRQINSRSDVARSSGSLCASPPTHNSPGSQSPSSASGYSQQQVKVAGGSSNGGPSRILSPEVEKIVSQINARHDTHGVKPPNNAPSPLHIRPPQQSPATMMAANRTNFRAYPDATALAGTPSLASVVEQNMALRALSPQLQLARHLPHQQQQQQLTYALSAGAGGGLAFNAMLSAGGAVGGGGAMLQYADASRLAGLPVNLQTGQLLGLPSATAAAASFPSLASAGYQLAANPTSSYVLSNNSMYAAAAAAGGAGQYTLPGLSAGGLVPMAGGYYAMPGQDMNAATQLFRMNAAGGGGLTPSIAGLPGIAAAQGMSMGGVGAQGVQLAALQGLPGMGVVGQPLAMAGVGGMALGVPGLPAYQALGMLGAQYKRVASDVSTLGAEKRVKYM